jgi:copper(I)-binding protein
LYLSVIRIIAKAGILLPIAAAAQVKVDDAWVRATVEQQRATGAFMKLTGAQDLRLIEARSPVAGLAEVHEMKLEDNVMKMRPISGFALPAGQAVELKPGGRHLMLMDLKQQVTEGTSVPITMVFEDANGKRTSVEIMATVRPLGKAGGTKEEAHHHH